MDFDATDLTVFITREGNEFVTDSRAVALVFGKLHGHVMRSINGMHASQHPEIADHARSNFGLCSYADAGTGRVRPMYRMTADGLSELAMSFTGEQSRVVRIRFIAAFREMAKRLDDREKTITQMLSEFGKRAAVSESKGRMGSLLMHGRRKEKPALTVEESTLKAIAQPPLFLN